MGFLNCVRIFSQSKNNFIKYKMLKRRGLIPAIIKIAILMSSVI